MHVIVIVDIFPSIGTAAHHIAVELDSPLAYFQFATTSTAPTALAHGCCDLEYIHTFVVAFCMTTIMLLLLFSRL